jgi:hypothetical protein
MTSIETAKTTSAAVILVSFTDEHAIYEGTLDACVGYASHRGVTIFGTSGRILGFIGRRAIWSSDVWTYDLVRSAWTGEAPVYAGIIHRASETVDRWSLLLRRDGVM